MRYGVLGTIDVQGDSGRIDLGGPQQRRLLAVLLTSPGRVFRVDRLIDALWSEASAPDGASAAVLTYMSRLRARIGTTSIVTRDGGYLFDIGSSTVDALEFEKLVHEARITDPDTAVDLFNKALVLWRGPAFGEFATEWWAIATASRLEELRAVAAEERAATLMALGQSSRAVPELELLRIEFPLRERVAQLLMQALDAVGRKAEALRVFHALREELIENTGLGPSQRLIELERAIASDEGRPTAMEGRPLRGYILHEVIGRGSHGTVYAARQPGTERDVAIKVIRAEFADSPEYVRRFAIEAQLVARIEHSHIVPLYDYWREPGGAYLVFRLMRGGTAEGSLVTGGRWSLERVGRLVEQVGNAMVSAHAAGIAHGDIRAANILLDDADNMFVSDFGIATETTAEGEGLDMLSDVREFALTIWELIAGYLPEKSPWSGSIPPLLDRVPDLPASIDAVLTRAVARPPQDAFESMAEFILAWRAANSRSGGVVGPVGTTAHRTTSDRRLAARQLSAHAQAGVNPYRGLRPFAEADARDFFGRGAIAANLCEAVDRSGLVAVVGPSGSGKSSLVQAGLLPLLRERGGRLVTSMTPGARPLDALHAALTVVSRTPLDPNEPEASIRDVARQSGSGLVLIIDQLEECWTLPDVSARDRFLVAVAAFPREPADPPISVVVTLRADMYDRPLQHPTIGSLIGAATFPITPMSAAELEDAVQLPAARAHVSFEDGVVSSIVTETVSNPASLPLLQFTLFQLFERRIDGRVTAAAYDALGGVAGALARRADDLYERSIGEDREHIRLLFNRLVNPGIGTPDSRRRALVGDLPERSRALADEFVAARLLVRDHDRVTREPTIEVAHEAILTRWSRLSGWIEDDRRWLSQLHHLSGAARVWDQAGRPAAELYRGSRLEAALEALPGRRDQLTATEIDFIESGQRARDAELEQRRRSTRRLRRSLVGVALLLVLATVSAVVAIAQRRTADRATREERISALVGDINSIRSTHRDTAALLAIEALRLADTPATRSALLSAFTSSPGFLDSHHLGDDLRFFAGTVVPSDGQAYVIDTDNLVHEYDLASGRLGDPFERALPSVAIDNFTGAGNHPGLATTSALVPSPDGKLLAQVFGATDPNEGDTTAIAMLDVATRRQVGPVMHVGISAGTFAFSPDQRELVVSGGADGSTVAFDIASGAELARLPGQSPAETLASQIWQTAGLAFIDPKHLAVGSVVDTIRIVDPLTLAPIGDPIVVPQNSTRALFSLDGGATLLGSGRNSAVLVDVKTGKVAWALDSEKIAVASCSGIAVVPERSHFYCSDSFGRLEERSLIDGSRIRQLDAQNGAVTSLWPTRHGAELVAFGSSERVVSRWRLDGSGPITQRVAPGLAGSQYSPNGKLLIGRLPSDSSFNDSVDDQYVLIEPSTGRITERLGKFNFPFWNDDDSLGGAIITPDGLRVATYRLATHDVVPGDFVFTRTISNNINNAGQPRAWVALPNGDDTWDIWTFERPSARRVERTVTVKSLVSLSGSPDGRRIAIATTSGVRVFDVDTGTEVASIDGRPDLRGVYFVTDDLIAIASLGGELTVHDVATLATVRTLNGSRGFVQDVQPTADGSLIAADGGDRSVQLIDVASGTPIGGPIPVADNEWNGFAFQPNGRELAVGGGSNDGIAIWDLDPQDWVDAACLMAGRDLTKAEWDTYLGTLGDYHATCA